jgi:biopolymer transport protein ExbD
MARVDLTPMVDLGFLLITFFIFSSTLSETKAMPLFMPKDSSDSMKVAESSVIQLVVYADRVVAFPGREISQGRTFDMRSPQALRIYLQQQESLLSNRSKKQENVFITIKPTQECTLKQVVDVLDEMTICNIKSYVLAEPTTEELSTLSKVKDEPL